jgi:hypothetical protein
MSMTSADLLGALDWHAGQTVLAPRQPAPGAWVGAPSAVAHDGAIHLAYRVRRPVGQGRGFANVVARSVDGVRWETLAIIERERHRADSLERPCLVRLDDDRWRLYISCATEHSKHWRVDMLESDTIEGLPDSTPVTVLPGDNSVGVKDPVILRDSAGWHLWASCHPLDDPDATDRMTTEYAVSVDGVQWRWQGTALAGTPGTWDARGVRFAAVLAMSDGYLGLYDGRATASENWEERTGAALSDSIAGPWRAVDGPQFISPFGSGGLRYLCTVTDPAGGLRIYYESACAGGSHELRTQLINRTAGASVTRCLGA